MENFISAAYDDDDDERTETEDSLKMDQGLSDKLKEIVEILKPLKEFLENTKMEKGDDDTEEKLAREEFDSEKLKIIKEPPSEDSKFEKIIDDEKEKFTEEILEKHQRQPEKEIEEKMKESPKLSKDIVTEKTAEQVIKKYVVKEVIIDDDDESKKFAVEKDVRKDKSPTEDLVRDDVLEKRKESTESIESKTIITERDDEGKEIVRKIEKIHIHFPEVPSKQKKMDEKAEKISKVDKPDKTTVRGKTPDEKSSPITDEIDERLQNLRKIEKIESGKDEPETDKIKKIDKPKESTIDTPTEKELQKRLESIKSLSFEKYDDATAILESDEEEEEEEIKDVSDKKTEKPEEKRGKPEEKDGDGEKPSDKEVEKSPPVSDGKKPEESEKEKIPDMKTPEFEDYSYKITLSDEEIIKTPDVTHDKKEESPSDHGGDSPGFFSRLYYGVKGALTSGKRPESDKDDKDDDDEGEDTKPDKLQKESYKEKIEKTSILVRDMKTPEDSDSDYVTMSKKVVYEINEEYVVDKKDEPERILDKKEEPEKKIDKKDESERIHDKKDELEKILNMKEEPQKKIVKKDEPERTFDKKDEPERIIGKKEEPERILDKKEEPEKKLDKKDEPEKFFDVKEEPEKTFDKKEKPEKILGKKEEPERILDRKDEPEKKPDKKESDKTPKVDEPKEKITTVEITKKIKTEIDESIKDVVIPEQKLPGTKPDDKTSPDELTKEKSTKYDDEIITTRKTIKTVDDFLKQEKQFIERPIKEIEKSKRKEIPEIVYDEVKSPETDDEEKDFKPIIESTYTEKIKSEPEDDKTLEKDDKLEKQKLDDDTIHKVKHVEVFISEERDSYDKPKLSKKSLEEKTPPETDELTKTDEIIITKQIKIGKFDDEKISEKLKDLQRDEPDTTTDKKPETTPLKRRDKETPEESLKTFLESEKAFSDAEKKSIESKTVPKKILKESEIEKPSKDFVTPEKSPSESPEDDKEKGISVTKLDTTVQKYKESTEKPEEIKAGKIEPKEKPKEKLKDSPTEIQSDEEPSIVSKETKEKDKKVKKPEDEESEVVKTKDSSVDEKPPKDAEKKLEKPKTLPGILKVSDLQKDTTAHLPDMTSPDEKEFKKSVPDDDKTGFVVVKTKKLTVLPDMKTPEEEKEIEILFTTQTDDVKHKKDKPDVDDIDDDEVSEKSVKPEQEEPGFLSRLYRGVKDALSPSKRKASETEDEKSDGEQQFVIRDTKESDETKPEMKSPTSRLPTETEREKDDETIIKSVPAVPDMKTPEEEFKEFITTVKEPLEDKPEEPEEQTDKQKTKEKIEKDEKHADDDEDVKSIKTTRVIDDDKIPESPKSREIDSYQTVSVLPEKIAKMKFDFNQTKSSVPDMKTPEEEFYEFPQTSVGEKSHETVKEILKDEKIKFISESKQKFLDDKDLKKDDSVRVTSIQMKEIHDMKKGHDDDLQPRDTFQSRKKITEKTTELYDETFNSSLTDESITTKTITMQSKKITKGIKDEKIVEPEKDELKHDKIDDMHEKMEIKHHEKIQLQETKKDEIIENEKIQI